MGFGCRDLGLYAVDVQGAWGRGLGLWVLDFLGFRLQFRGFMVPFFPGIQG